MPSFSPDSRRPISLPNQRLLKNRSITALTTMTQNTEKLWNQIVELKCTSKLLQRQSRRCIKDKKSNELKIKKAIEKGNIDLARIHAETAIRNHNSQLTYLRLSSRLDGLVSRLQTQATINTITKSISTIVKTLESTLMTENLQKMSETMDQFERQFVDMEVKGEVMESSLAGSMAGSVAEGDVDSLMQQVVEDYGLAVSVGLPKAGVHAITAELKEKVEEDDLRTRLAELKQHG